MVQKSLIKYIKGLVQKGYDIFTIRNVLLKYGYTNKDVDEALNLIYHPAIRHEIHLSGTTIFVIVFIFVSLLGTASFFYFNKSETPTKLLDLNLEPVVTTVEAGDSIAFLKELSNFGSSNRYDVVIKQEILEQKTFKVVTEKTETRAIETFGSTQTRILMPQDTKPGDYILRVIIEYGNKRAIATLPVKIIAPTKKTCFDSIKNQNEEGIDCGGECKPCEKQIMCGNNICEEQETESCAADCQKLEPPPELTPDTLDKIKELARLNPSKALQQCNKFEVPDLIDSCIGNIGEVQRNKNYCKQIINLRIKDLCYSNIAKSTNDNSLCEEISTESRKDSCYMTFVIDNKDYSVCYKLNNTQLRLSCESLKQLYEINREQNQVQENQKPESPI